jgi:tripartite-type tricarboxylate transporter receptor subunit TctC
LPLSDAREPPRRNIRCASSFHLSVWHGIWVLKKTPAPIIAKINAAIIEVIPPQDQKIPQTLATWRRSEIEKWRPIIKAIGVVATPIFNPDHQL